MKQSKIFPLFAIASIAVTNPLLAGNAQADIVEERQTPKGSYFIMRQSANPVGLHLEPNGTVRAIGALGEGGSVSHIAGYIDHETTLVTDPDTGTTLSLSDIINGFRFGEATQ